MPKRSKATALTIPPPVLGWNTKDPLSEMNPLYAVELENFFPAGGSVDLRNGYTFHAARPDGNGYTLLDELVDTAGTRSLIALTVGGAPVNVTAAGLGVVILGGLSTGSFYNYSVNYRGRLYIKGESLANDIYSTDGVNATLPGFTGPGGDDKALWRLTTYKNRLYALSLSDASMWYSGFDAITGAMTQFDFQSLFTLGGRPWYIGPFSMTGGDVTQEYFAVISEQGETLLYSGFYPGDPDWQIVGRYYLPAPAGHKCFFNWGPDILIVTYEGLVSLREYIGTPTGQTYVFLSDNIASAFKEAVANTDPVYLSLIQGIVYPKGQYLLVNFYFLNGTATQFVMNTQTRAWTKFTGQGAVCWALFNNHLYWGGAGARLAAGGSYVAKADNGAFDDDPNSTDAILTRTIKLRPAYNYFGNREQKKQFVLCQPIVYQSEGLSLAMKADVDYENEAATGPITETGDNSYKIYRPRIALKDVGYAASLRIDGTVTTKRMSLQATQVIFNDGDIL